MRKFWGVFVVLAVALGFAVAPAMAQQTSAVSGVVTDKTGAVLVGVDVTLDNPRLGVHAVTTTNDIGYYQFLKLNPAEGYQLTFTKDGFHKLQINNVTLGVSTVETRNESLELGNVTQTIEVTASGEATLNTTDATIGNVINTRSVSELPIQARLDAANLMQLQAGVNSSGAITGARPDQGNITLDGMDINDQATGQEFTSTIPVSIDALQEVRTVTAGETADFGRSSGGMINLVTRSGTNEWHGNLSEYNRNTLSSANSWFGNRNGIPRPALIRNQFGGSIGGPIKKDKMFFFFNYEGLRRASSSNVERSVPTPAFLQGQIGYINDSEGCDSSARLNTAPQCISFLDASQVQSLDPSGVGVNNALLAYMASRYPAPNDPTGGDGINSMGYFFTTPAHESDNVYTGRLDYNLSDAHKFFVRGNVAREGVDDNFNTDIVQFPGDPFPNSRDTFNSYAFTLGWTWTKSANVINQLSVGLVRTIDDFPARQSASYPQELTFGGPFSNPYLSSSSQSRNVPIPEFRDGLTWTRGKHTMDFGVDVKLIRQISMLKNDFNFVGLGLGGQIQSLDTATGPAACPDSEAGSLRPCDINLDSSAINSWDTTFPFLLGRFSSASTNFNYDTSGDPLAAGTGKHRYYNYNEFEFYAQDSWRVRSDLTITFGLRYDLHTVPYEINGFQSVPSVNENQFLATRVAAAAQGLSGIDVVPIVSYSLGGKANNAPGYYDPDYKDFGPRLAVAYNPSIRSGWLHDIFGDRKSTIRAGAAILHDRIGGGASFGLDQFTYLFDANGNNPLGIFGNPVGSLETDPRFTAINEFPDIFPAAPSVAAPSQPNVVDGVPIGTSELGGFPQLFQYDRNTKNPYSILLNFGIQRELPGNFLLEANYVGRLGRRLLAVGDAATTMNALDPSSGQLLKAAFGSLQQQLNSGVPFYAVTDQPWFENQMGGTENCQDFSSANYGISLSCSGLATGLFGTLFRKGDLSDTVAGLTGFGALDYNVGLPAQTAANGYIGNYASSSYNALLLTLRKRVSNGLQFDFNYTLSHSIDNVSDVINGYVQYASSSTGLVCNLLDLRACRASSDFDVRHTISGNYLYDLPFGRGRRFLHDSHGVVDAVFGGWTWTGIVTFRTGFPFSARTGSFPTSYTLDSPALLVGPTSALKPGIHTDAGGDLQFFKDPDSALNALDFPQGGNTGTRNIFNGPGFWNVDMGVTKSFRMPWSETQKLVFRWDSFNTFNHPSFSIPSATLNSTGSFGLITSTSSAPRVMQYALRFEF